MTSTMMTCKHCRHRQETNSKLIDYCERCNTNDWEYEDYVSRGEFFT